MGINAFFTYTLVHSMKLDWREALTVVVITGVLFSIVAFTSLYRILSEAIPQNLQHAITVGIGLFLTFIGLQKSGIVIAHQTTFVAIGHFSDPAVITSCVTLLLALVLFIRGTRGGLLISMLVGTGLAYLLGAAHVPKAQDSGHVFTGYGDLFLGMDWSGRNRKVAPNNSPVTSEVRPERKMPQIAGKHGGKAKTEAQMPLFCLYVFCELRRYRELLV